METNKKANSATPESCALGSHLVGLVEGLAMHTAGKSFSCRPQEFSQLQKCCKYPIGSINFLFKNFYQL